ncbi:MAG: PepSY domain-containing protein [Neisseria sp.]|nr:PepSY domain-containing protein [Neisseria sp.]
MKFKHALTAALSALALLAAAPALADDDDRDDDEDRRPRYSQSHKAKKTRAKHGRHISREQAKRAALSRVGGRVKDIDFDRDDDRPHYDVEITKNGREYDVKVDARTGRVISVRRED